MKRIILIMLVLLISGCNNDDLKININKNEVIDIGYNNLTFIPEDYEEIIKLIYNLNFSKNWDYSKNSQENSLIIATNDQFYIFDIHGSIISLFDHSSETLFYASDTQDLIEFLNNSQLRYTNINFFDIGYNQEYDNNTHTIRLDNTNNYLLLNLYDNVFNFKINSIENDDDSNFIDTNLLYEKDQFYDDSEIVIRTDINNNNLIRISFENKYNYRFSIIPFLDEGKIEFTMDIKQK